MIHGPEADPETWTSCTARSAKGARYPRDCACSRSCAPEYRLLNKQTPAHLISGCRSLVGDGRGEIRRDRSSRTRDLDRPTAFRDDRRPAWCRSARNRQTCGQTEEGVPERSRIIYKTSSNAWLRPGGNTCQVLLLSTS